MPKGWVGESERQLRLLFDQAYQLRPSLIFFDDIDGLAPVTSSRQDQIHSSIVYTLPLLRLLVWMNGLEIMVIGATNRIEAINPALRGSGMFDCELYFPLPSLQALKHMLSLQTSLWQPPPTDYLLKNLADQTSGYCSADLKSMCCKAVLASLRKQYPQVYESTVKLQLYVNSFVGRFHHSRSALGHIARIAMRPAPAAQRSRGSIGEPLQPEVRPLLQATLQKILLHLEQSFPRGPTPNYSDDRRVLYRPRLLLVGNGDLGQSSDLGPAIIHAMDSVPAHKLNFTSLYEYSSRTPEKAVVEIFHEASSRPPSIIFMPHFDDWVESTDESVRAIFFSLMEDLKPGTPVLLLATSHRPLAEVDPRALELFNVHYGEVITLSNPTRKEREEFFRPLFYNHMVKPKAHWTCTCARQLYNAELSSDDSEATSSVPVQSTIASSTTTGAANQRSALVASISAAVAEMSTSRNLTLDLEQDATTGSADANVSQLRVMYTYIFYLFQKHASVSYKAQLLL
ncbi:hypothetical protein HAZT_HAZT009589, partial [Hyalella azteca]